MTQARKVARLFVANLKQELESRVQDLRSRLKAYTSDSEPLNSEDKRALGEFAKWFKERFRVDSAKTPKGMKLVKEEAARFLQTLEIGGSSGTVFSTMLGKVVEFYETRLSRDVDSLVKHFTSEGDIGKGKSEALVEIRGSHATYRNNANVSEDNFKKVVANLDRIFATVKGWRAKAFSGGLKVVLVGSEKMKVAGKYKRDLDELWLLATPKILKRSQNTYASPEYIIIHELGHRYERLHRTPDVEGKAWVTTPYSQKDGEAYAELFALGHFDGIKGPWDETVQRFEELMASY